MGKRLTRAGRRMCVHLFTCISRGVCTCAAFLFDTLLAELDDWVHARHLLKRRGPLGRSGVAPSRMLVDC